MPFLPIQACSEIMGQILPGSYHLTLLQVSLDAPPGRQYRSVDVDLLWVIATIERRQC